MAGVMSQCFFPHVLDRVAYSAGRPIAEVARRDNGHGAGVF